MKPTGIGALPRITRSVFSSRTPASSTSSTSSTSWLRGSCRNLATTRASSPYIHRLTRPQTRRLASAVDLQFGQPLHETHPHLLQPGEITPGITALEYAERRARLAASLPPNSVAILAAADVKYRSGSVFYRFHQEPDFLYLTGFNEPDACAVIEKTGSGAEHTFHLYVRPKDPRIEQWEGSRSGVQAAQDVFNADEAGSIDSATSILSKIIDRNKKVYTDIPSSIGQSSKTIPTMILGSSGTLEDVVSRGNTQPLRPLMNNLRVIKSDAEVRNLRKAGQASGRAFTEAMRHQFKNERDLENFLDYEFKYNGCEEVAYVPVVAGGSNANQIHYVRNDMALQEDELVTVDAGGEYGGYVTDITRSWPVNGKFTAAQRDLYEVILKTQRTCVSLCREDAYLSLDKLHNVAEEGLRDGLKSIGFDLNSNRLDGLFPHHVGHHIGLAVHDAPAHPRTVPLTKNQCITIEPGVYVPDDERWPAHFRGIGIRIEDSVCIQEETPLVLTTEAVKEVIDIEALRR